MARRNRYAATLGYRNSDDRSSLGDSHVENAIIELNRSMMISANAQTSYGHTREATVQMLFEPDTIQKMQAVRGLVTPSSPVASYPMFTNCSLSINYDGAQYPTIDPKAMVYQTHKIGPLLSYLKDLERVYLAFEEVKATLKWLNRNATPGAIRYYWPPAMKLVPKSPIWPDLTEVPSRYTTPTHLSEMQQMLKDASGTVTGMLMLPNDVKPKPIGQLRVQFDKRQVEVGEHTRYTTDTMIFNA